MPAPGFAPRGRCPGSGRLEPSLDEDAMMETRMVEGTLDRFIAECRAAAEERAAPADVADAIAPLMMRLVAGDKAFLRVEHLRPHPHHYARNAIHVAGDASLSLYALVWLPGQWTPVHDHGSWGVVGVVQGVLEERSFIAADGEIRSDSGIRLRRGGAVLLDRGSVSTFVPDPDHIHMTGAPARGDPGVSLHLYGRNMDSFHVYDVVAGTRRLVDVAASR
jgi:predicted metal-dependent enzyme (double-stranded beta helix superfamily)